MNLSILLFLLYSTSFCKSDDYQYDDYDYDNYYYEGNYDYNNQKSEDYTDDYNQELNDYYGNQNLLAPAPPPPFIPPPTPPPPPPPPVDFNSCINNWCHQKGTMGQYTRCKSVSNNGRTCHNPEIKIGSNIGGKPGGVWYGPDKGTGCFLDRRHMCTNALTEWCKSLFPTTPKIYGTSLYKVIYLFSCFLCSIIELYFQ